MIDALLPEMLPGADILILGADSVTPEYFINKAGSTTLLKAARTHGLKTAVVFESLKAGRPENSHPLALDKEPGEIWPGRRNRNITVLNQYFEPISNRLVDYFISDDGFDTPDALHRRVKKIT